MIIYLSKLLLFIIILSSCTYIPQRIVEKETKKKVFIPLAISIPNKFGVAGGNEKSTKIIGGSWFYTWSAANNSQSVEFVPMIWDETHIDDKIISNSNYILGFNEPDLSGQANLSPEEAAKYWNILEQKYPNKRLISPAPSHENVEWLEKFRNAYYQLYDKYPKFDGIAFHCYKPWARECIEVGEYFINLAHQWGISEIWCTEFAFLKAWNGNYRNEINIFTTWLESEEIIKRYSPYVSNNGKCPSWYWTDCREGANPSLFQEDLITLTSLGWLYAKK